MESVLSGGSILREPTSTAIRVRIGNHSYRNRLEAPISPRCKPTFSLQLALLRLRAADRALLSLFRNTQSPFYVHTYPKKLYQRYCCPNDSTKPEPKRRSVLFVLNLGSYRHCLRGRFAVKFRREGRSHSAGHRNHGFGYRLLWCAGQKRLALWTFLLNRSHVSVTDLQRNGLDGAL